ncbi:MAG: class I SAM-dependent methyltransferase [Bryobacteraceae bacterium]
MDHPNRRLLEETERLVASFNIAPGDVVADVGTGVGYLLPYLVRTVGPTGRIIAEDIYPDLLSTAEDRINKHAWTNVQVVVGAAQNPQLPTGVLDVALAVDVYHHLDYPAQMLGHIRRALKPTGRLIIVEFYLNRPHPRARERELREHIRLDRDAVIEEVEEQGYQRLDQFDHLSYQYVLVFGKA